MIVRSDAIQKQTDKDRVCRTTLQNYLHPSVECFPYVDMYSEDPAPPSFGGMLVVVVCDVVICIDGTDFAIL